MSDHPRGRADLFCQEVSDGCVLFDPDGQKVYVLNPTAAFVWICCDGEHGLDEMVEELAETLGSGAPDRARLRTDVEKALDDFKRQGLLSA